MLQMVGPPGAILNASDREVPVVDGAMAFQSALRTFADSTLWDRRFGRPLGELGTACPIYDPTRPPPAPPVPPTITFPSVDVSVLWGTFWKDGKAAPGGNWYWNAKPIPDTDGAAKKGLALAAAISKLHFQHYFGPGQEHASMRMDDVLATYKGKLVVSYGSLTVPVLPFLGSKGPTLFSSKPAERADEFVNRGGYLFWVDPDTGVYSAKQYIVTEARIVYTDPNSHSNDWTETKFDLFLRYDPSKRTVKFEVRRFITTTEKIEKDLISFMNLLAKGGSGFCGLVTSDKVAAAAAYAAAVPAATPYITGWQVATAVCGIVFPKCPPPPPPQAGAPPPPPPPASSIAPPLATAQPWYKNPTTYKIAGGIGAASVVALLLRSALR
jgi:hypothetical protein